MFLQKVHCSPERGRFVCPCFSVQPSTFHPENLVKIQFFKFQLAHHAQKAEGIRSIPKRSPKNLDQTQPVSENTLYVGSCSCKQGYCCRSQSTVRIRQSIVENLNLWFWRSGIFLLSHLGTNTCIWRKMSWLG